ncbi:MAG: methylmalonyl-CoA mutase family protein [Pseudomonadota bacterium]
MTFGLEYHRTGGEVGWRAAAEAALKGKSLETLISRLVDGVEIKPIHPLDMPSHGRAFRVSAEDWTVCQRVDVPDTGVANTLLRADLEGGTAALDFVFPGGLVSEGGALSVATVSDLKRLLDGVHLPMIRLRLSAGQDAPEVSALVLACFDEIGVAPDQITLDAGIDVIGAFAARGRLDTSYDVLKRIAADAVLGLQASGIGGTWLTADGRPVHAAGGSEAQELAFALACAIWHFRMCDETGIGPEVVAERIEMALIADEDVFVSTAKLRAARLLWRRALAEMSLAHVPLRLHAETSWRSLARRDPHVNLLRGTAAAAAAAFGGVDSLTVLPFSAALGVADGFARRIARNTQIVLQEEAGLGRILDPAAGAGHVEALTQELAQRAWDEFREMEAQGGIVAALRSGAFQNTVAELRDARSDDLVHGRATLTGVNAFPFLEQPDAAVLESVEASESAAGDHAAALPDPGEGKRFAAAVNAFAGGESLQVLMAARPSGEDRVTPIHPIRLASDFEDLCDAADAVAADTGTRPSVLLVTLGSLASYSARATWTKNLFAAGGLDAPFGDTGFATPDDAVAAANDAGAWLTVLCGSDAAYADQAEAVAAALSEINCTVWLAGRPGPMEEALKAAGVSGFLFAGCDMLDMLRAAHRVLGVPSATDMLPVETG